MTRYTRQEVRQFHQLAQLLSRSIDATRSKAALPTHAGAWEVLIKVAGRNLVLPNLHPVLKAKGLLGAIDPGIVDALEGFFELNVLRNASLREQLIETTELLNAVRIDPIWLKGATYLLGPEWKSSGRMMLDIDFWIPDPQDQQTALLELKRAGYGRMPEYDSDDPYGARHHHFAPLIRADRPAPLELHRNVVSESFRSLLPDAAALERTQWVTWNGKRIGVLSPCDRAMQAYIQCAEMEACFWLDPRFSSSLMKIGELQNRLAELDDDDLATMFLLPLQRVPWSAFASELFTLLERDFGAMFDFPTDQRSLKRKELKFAQLWLRRRAFVEHHPRLLYSASMAKAAFRSIWSGSCGLPQHWPRKLSYHLQRFKKL